MSRVAALAGLKAGDGGGEFCVLSLGPRCWGRPDSFLPSPPSPGHIASCGCTSASSV